MWRPWGSGHPVTLLVMGVSGAGKTTVGTRLARELGWVFLEADLFHPLVNIQKMRAGIPLADADRTPWLEAIHERLITLQEAGQSVVLACSALRRSYRAILERGIRRFVVVHLVAPADVIRSRITGRTGHFMNPALVDSQFRTLEAAEEVLQVDARLPVESIVGLIREELAI